MSALLIDTSSPQTLIAFGAGDTLLDSISIPHENQLAKILLPTIQEMLKKQTSKLGYIGVGVGPGSYTGTRVGVVVGKALSFALKIPLIPFCSLLAFTSEKKGKFGSIMSAKSGNFYLLKGHLDDSVSITLSELLSKEALIAHTQDCDYLTCQNKNDLPSDLPEVTTPPPQLKTPLLYTYQQYRLGDLKNHNQAHLIYLHAP